MEKMVSGAGEKAESAATMLGLPLCLCSHSLPFPTLLCASRARQLGGPGRRSGGGKREWQSIYFSGSLPGVTTGQLLLWDEGHRSHQAEFPTPAVPPLPLRWLAPGYSIAPCGFPTPALHLC